MKNVTHEQLERQWNNPYLQWWAAGMPSYSCPSLKPYKKLIINFETKEDREAFLELCNFKDFTDKTKVTNYPQKNNDINRMNRFIDDSEL